MLPTPNYAVATTNLGTFVPGVKVVSQPDMWEKGQAIMEHYRGVKCPSYRQMEKETLRDRRSLKKWHKLYLAYPNKDDYCLIAVEEAKEWLWGV